MYAVEATEIIIPPIFRVDKCLVIFHGKRLPRAQTDRLPFEYKQLGLCQDGSALYGMDVPEILLDYESHPPQVCIRITKRLGFAPKWTSPSEPDDEGCNFNSIRKSVDWIWNSFLKDSFGERASRDLRLLAEAIPDKRHADSAFMASRINSALRTAFEIELRNNTGPNVNLFTATPNNFKQTTNPEQGIW